MKADIQPRLLVAFTQPEIAQVKVDEEASEKQDLRISIAPLTLTARSNITDQRTGFVKIITRLTSLIFQAKYRINLNICQSVI